MKKNNLRKGIILAGGTGSRLFPLTTAVSKQLLPVFDKPMIYYPLCTLMLAGIRDILIITTGDDQDNFKRLLGDGNSLGIKLNYAIQEVPEGLAQAVLIGGEFLDGSPSAVILGDNLFHGQNLIKQLKSCKSEKKGATVFAYPVMDPKRYGVVEFNTSGKVISIEEKPKNPKSIYALTGLYFFDSNAPNLASRLKPSKSGELEITDLLKLYLNESLLEVKIMGRGMAWLDTGTFNSLNNAGEYIRIMEQRQGLKICCPEEVAWRNHWINDKDLENLAKPLIKSGYGSYLLKLLKENSYDRALMEINIK